MSKCPTCGAPEAAAMIHEGKIARIRKKIAELETRRTNAGRSVSYGIKVDYRILTGQISVLEEVLAILEAETLTVTVIADAPEVARLINIETAAEVLVEHWETGGFLLSPTLTEDYVRDLARAVHAVPVEV